MVFKRRTLEEVMQTHQDFKPGWKPDSNGGLENPRFAKVSRVVACMDDGTPIYDQFMIEEKPGVLIIPYDTHDGIVRVGLITEERFITGKWYVSVPRGFIDDNETIKQAAARELSEETGLTAEEFTVLGENNADVLYFRTTDPIIAGRCKKIEEGHYPLGAGLGEAIQKVKPYTFREIIELRKTGQLECGMTKAALFEFGCFMPEFYRT